MEVKVPKKVAEAFDYHHRMWVAMSAESRNYLFMALPSTRSVQRESLVLKDYAQKNPTKYVQALANGYDPEINAQDEIEQMITEWINSPYADNKKKDIKDFARMVTKYFQQNG